MIGRSSFGRDTNETDVALLPLQQFRRALDAPRLRGVRAPSTGSCPTPGPVPPIVDTAYTYSIEEICAVLWKNQETIAIHRGPAPSDPEIAVHRLCDEHIMPFASAQRGSVHLSRRDLVDLVTGRLRRWEALGCGSGAIRLLAHGAPINQRTLLASLSQNLGIDCIAAPVEVYGSYEELADAAQGCNDCLVLGLRPSWLGNSGLVPVCFEGVEAWQRGPAPAIPALATSLAWRRSLVQSPTLAHDVERIVTIIRGRLEADAEAVERFAPADRRRAA